MEVRFSTAVTRGFFPPRSGSVSYRSRQRKKNPLAPRVLDLPISRRVVQLYRSCLTSRIHPFDFININKHSRLINSKLLQRSKISVVEDNKVRRECQHPLCGNQRRQVERGINLKMAKEIKAKWNTVVPVGAGILDRVLHLIRLCFNLI